MLHATFDVAVVGAFEHVSRLQAEVLFNSQPENQVLQSPSVLAVIARAQVLAAHFVGAAGSKAHRAPIVSYTREQAGYPSVAF